MIDLRNKENNSTPPVIHSAFSKIITKVEKMLQNNKKNYL